jgi:hypothetical protein
VFDPDHPLPNRASGGLRATRTIRPSPFPEEKGRVWYFAGFDAFGGPSHLNTTADFMDPRVDAARLLSPHGRGQEHPPRVQNSIKRSGQFDHSGDGSLQARSDGIHGALLADHIDGGNRLE